MAFAITTTPCRLRVLVGDTQRRSRQWMSMIDSRELSSKFEDAAAVAREMVALGYADEARSLDGPGISVVIDRVCSTGRERDAPTWHQHSAF
jgi:hypothetical protein